MKKIVTALRSHVPDGIYGLLQNRTGLPADVQGHDGNDGILPD